MSNTAKAPTEDLRKAAIEHYEEVSLKAHRHLTSIPRAINYYWDMHSDQPLDNEIINEVLDRGEWIQTNVYEFYNEDGYGYYLIRFNDSRFRLLNMPMAGTEQQVRFEGVINNKAELKKILIQTQIINSEA